MTANIIDGKKVAQKIQDGLKEKINKLKTKPGLAVIIVGDDPASVVYTNNKVKACKEIGIYSEKHELSADIAQEELLELIEKLNNDKKINGILVQLPLPEQIDENAVINAIDPKKDVDGFHPSNMGRVLLGKPYLAPCTAVGVLKLLDEYKIELEGKDVCIVGHSYIVGKPLAALCLNRDATISVCHIRTKNLKEHTLRADIIMTATGVPGLIKADMVKEGAVVVDIGIFRKGNKIVGDVDFENVRERCSYITPVPGGVGPMTIACLLENTLLAYKEQV